MQAFGCVVQVTLRRHWESGTIRELDLMGYKYEGGYHVWIPQIGVKKSRDITFRRAPPMLPDGRPTEDIQHGWVQNAISLKLTSVIQTANPTSMQDDTESQWQWQQGVSTSTIATCGKVYFTCIWPCVPRPAHLSLAVDLIGHVLTSWVGDPDKTRMPPVCTMTFPCAWLIMVRQQPVSSKVGIELPAPPFPSHMRPEWVDLTGTTHHSHTRDDSTFSIGGMWGKM